MSSPPPHRGRWGRWGAVTCELGPGRSAPGLPAGAGGFLPPASRAVCPPLRLWRGRQPGRCLLRPLLPPPAELQSAPPGPTPPRPRRTWWPQPGSTSETVAPACRIPVGDEARGPSPSGSRPGCADGRHPSCRSTQPLHSDPDAGALGCLWRFPARAAHERQLWTDPRRAFGVRGARSAHSRLLGGPQSWLRGTDFQRLSRGQHLSAPRLPLVPVQKRGAHGAFVESLFAVSAQVS